MKLTLLTLIVSIAILQSCQSNLEVNFTEALQDCLSTEDINQLNKATAQFERKLMETYSSKNTNQNYLRFLEDFSAMNLNPDFILDSDSKTILDDLKASGTFDKIWISKLNNYKERNTESFIIEFEPKKKRGLLLIFLK